MRDTIEMAREADEYADMEWPLRPRGERWQKCRDERFEALVRADERSIEREACAKVCDSWSLRDSLAAEMAEEIRARGETK